MTLLPTSFLSDRSSKCVLRILSDMRVAFCSCFIVMGFSMRNLKTCIWCPFISNMLNSVKRGFCRRGIAINCRLKYLKLCNYFAYVGKEITNQLHVRCEFFQRLSILWKFFVLETAEIIKFSIEY